MPGRLSVSLSEGEREVLDSFIEPSSAEHEALLDLANEMGITLRSASEAAVARALLLAGVQTVRERVLEVGYERLAVDRDESRAERMAIRDRRLARSEGR